MVFDKDEIKNSLSIEQIQDIVAELGGEPMLKNNTLLCKTICHGGDSHKLYYYPSSHLFRCYTECDESFDIFELILKVKKREGENWTLYNAISFVANFFSLAFTSSKEELPDWQIFSKWERVVEQKEKSFSNRLAQYDDKILLNLPQVEIGPWEKEGITTEVCDFYNIRYNPVNNSVVIPHYDIQGRLVGIRERTLVKDNEVYGKYRPAYLNGKMYNHPLGFNLYGIDKAKDNIAAIHKAIVVEGEKSVLKYASLFGAENNICVAVCGSNLISNQVETLIQLGASEIIVGLDRQYQEIGDSDWESWTKKLTAIHDKYCGLVQISYLFDLEHKLGFKDSPLDQGKEIFLDLFQNRIFL